ncbi:LOG family protein [Trinickia sp. LjRoot230]|uniref:hypothetical protein n=1 Tax=Trinickia sp. LjRoot230 TaxID=3342288 RepID=UPI003ED03078
MARPPSNVEQRIIVPHRSRLSAEEIDRRGTMRNPAAVAARFERMRDLLRQMVDETSNDKPTIRDGDVWLLELLANMKEGNFVTQDPIEHVNWGRIRTDQIQTQFSEFSADTVAHAESIKQQLQGREVAVLGFVARELDEPLRQKQWDSADDIVLAAGDPHALHQFIEAFDYLRCRSPKDVPESKRQKRLIIADFEFYRPLLRRLFGVAPTGTNERFYYRQSLQALLRMHGPQSPRLDVTVEIPGSLEDLPAPSTKAIIGTQADQTESLADIEQRLVKVREVPCLFVGTNKVTKLAHLNAAFSGTTVTINSLMTLIDDLGNPDECHKTYAANARGLSGADANNSGKAESFARVIQSVLNGEHPTISREMLLDRLKKFGVTGKIYFMTDDRGAEFPDWDLLEPHLDSEFKKSVIEELKRRVGGQDMRIQPVPGVEMTWWINTAGGIEALFGYFERAYKKRLAKTNEDIPRKVTTACVATLVEMDLTTGDYEMRTYSGATTYDFRRPRADLPNRETSEAWYVEPGSHNPENRSMQEIMDASPEGARSPSLPWVKVVEAMRADGVVFANTRPVARVPDYKITFHGADQSTRGTALQMSMNMLMQRDNTGPRASARTPLPVIAPNRRGIAPAAAFDSYEIGRRIAGSDALIFDKTPIEFLARAKRFYEYFSALVLTSLHPDFANAAVLVNEEDEGMSILQEAVKTQYRYGLSEDPLSLTLPYASERDALDKLARHWKQYERLATAVTPEALGGSIAPTADFDVRAALDEWRDERHPAIVVLASGKAVAPALVEEIRVIAECIARLDADAISGGGAKGLMGALQQHYQRYATMLGIDGKVAGISTTMVIGKETQTGQLSSALQVKHVSPEIVTRMHQLFAADVAIVAAGGIGTAQEIGFILAAKAAGIEPFSRQPVLLVNSIMSDGKRLLDGYLEFFGAAPGTTREQRIATGRRLLEEIGVYVIDAPAGGLADSLDKRFAQLRADNPRLLERRRLVS